MPKIIENIREKLLEEAKRQVEEQGYSAMTIRSVATACGVGVGTVYNYFPSKDMLVASFMLEDWLVCLGHIEENCTEESEAKEVLHRIYVELLEFKQKYAGLFTDENALGSYSASFPKRHHMLRSQLAAHILTLTRRQRKAEPEFLADFIAEAMLTWTMADCEFEQIAEVVLQLL